MCRWAWAIGLLLGLWSSGRAVAAPVEFRAVPERSTLVVNVYRAGAFSPLLHDHHFVPQRWTATARVDPRDPSAVALEVVVDAQSLRDRQPALSANQRRQVERQVRSPTVLDATRFPVIRFSADRLELETWNPSTGALEGEVSGRLSLHGVERPLEVPVRGSLHGDRLQVEGRVAFLQTQFGIEPYRQLLGSIAVEDEVDVEFRIEARPG